MCGQSLIKVGQTRSNLIDGLKTTGLGKNHIQILIIRIEEYGDILVLVKFETNWMVRLRKHNHKVHSTCLSRARLKFEILPLDLKSVMKG